MESLSRQIRILKVCVATLALLLMAVIIAGVVLLRNNNRFAEITTGRINIVEPDGSLRMVISNQHSQHPGAVNGKEMPKRDRPAGMIFFNDDGDECGGIVYDGNKKEASFTYSVDQYKNDQIMQLQYQQDDDGGQRARSYGLKLWDRPEEYSLQRQIDYFDSLGKIKDTAAFNAGVRTIKAAGGLGTERLFLGKNKNGETGLFLCDDKGVPRLRIFIDKSNKPVIQTLNDRGETRSFSF